MNTPYAPPAFATPGAGLAGTSLYSPGAVAAYSLLGGLPLGCVLYGLNVARRGSRIMGTALSLLGAASYLFMLVATALGGESLAIYSFLGIFGAIGFYKLESGSFRQALNRGAVKASWWPPLLLALFSWVLIAIVVTLVMTSNS